MFNKDRAIIGQNAATAAATLLQGTGAGYDEFEAVRTAIAEGSLAFADGVVAGQTEAQAVTASRPTTGYKSSGGGGQSSDSGAGIAFKFGKHAGSTIAEVYGTDSKYIEWIAETSNNEFMRGKAVEYLASVS